MRPPFCTFLCRHCTTTTWKCLISLFVEDLITEKTTSVFFSWTLIQPFRIQLRKICQHLTNWTSWNKRDKLWSSANSLFKWRFGSRRCCLSSLLSQYTFVPTPYPSYHVTTSASYHPTAWLVIQQYYLSCSPMCYLLCNNTCPCPSRCHSHRESSFFWSVRRRGFEGESDRHLLGMGLRDRTLPVHLKKQGVNRFNTKTRKAGLNITSRLFG